MIMSERLTDSSKMLANAANDQELVTDLIDTFLRTSSSLMDELFEAQRVNDLETLARSAHTLKSPLSFFGADTTLEVAQSIESLADGGGHKDLDKLIAALSRDMSTILNELRSISE